MSYTSRLSPRLIWIDTRTLYTSQSFAQDLYFGVRNLRLSTCGDQFLFATEFYCGRYEYIKAQDLIENVKDFIVSNYNYPLIFRVVAEWTIAETVLKPISIVLSLLDKFHSSYTVLLHAGDTHHGRRPIQSILSFEQKINPDIISCNQIHHLHFFKSKYAVPNIPISKLTDISIVNKKNPYYAFDVMPTVYYPAVNNGIHLRRWELFKLIQDDSFLSSHLQSTRSSDFPNWLSMLNKVKLFLYHSLSTSIGLNNILPCSYSNTPVFANRLTKYTGQPLIYDFFGVNASYYDSFADLRIQLSKILKTSSEQVLLDDFDISVYSRKLPSACQLLDSLVSTDFDKIYSDLLPSAVDERFFACKSLLGDITTPISNFASIYEDAQVLLEYSLLPAFFHLISSKPCSVESEYIQLLFKDLSTHFTPLPSRLSGDDQSTLLVFLDAQSLLKFDIYDHHYNRLKNNLIYVPLHLVQLYCRSLISDISFPATLPDTMHLNGKIFVFTRSTVKV